MGIFKLKKYSDVSYVEGLLKKDSLVERDFYRCCQKYFEKYYCTVFFDAADEVKDDIFQEAFIILWTQIENGRIYIEGNMLFGKDGKPFTSSLTTYLMSIARLKYLELARKGEKMIRLDDVAYKEPVEWLDDDNLSVKVEVLTECLGEVSATCYEILTKFYIEEKSLDELMQVLPNYTSKDALKTAKSKCLNRLKPFVKNLYQIRKNL